MTYNVFGGTLNLAQLNLVGWPHWPPLTVCGYCYRYAICLVVFVCCVKMPEEQAFCVLVSIMYQYGLRNLFRQGFEELHLKFYQLERLIQVLPRSAAFLMVIFI